MKRYLLALLLALAFASPSFAVDGDLFLTETNAGHQVRIDTNGVLIGAKSNYEVIATSETITAAETGKTISVVMATQYGGESVTLTLPTAAVGLEYTFIADTKSIVYLDPQSTDTIKYGTAVFLAGDKIGNTSAATADSITLICPVANYWSVKAVNGTWADSN